ncbi:protein of unknown function [Ectopseudomonas oleovorans]|nr:protein of unknown function [Pseudomonas oleovorans]
MTGKHNKSIYPLFLLTSNVSQYVETSHGPDFVFSNCSSIKWLRDKSTSLCILQHRSRAS